MSRGSLSRETVENDFHCIFVKNVELKLVFPFSLGTAVSSQVVADLSECGSPPDALILESPFNNIRDEIRCHPMTFLWRKMPMFEYIFTSTLSRSDVAFFSDKAIQSIHVPVLILHARDDHVVPFDLGRKLYEVARESRNRGVSKSVIFIPFEADFG